MSVEDWEKSFARNFLFLRRENKLTQKQMAEKLKTSIYTVRKIEHGTVPKKLSVKLLINIYQTFGVCAKELFK